MKNMFKVAFTVFLLAGFLLTGCVDPSDVSDPYDKETPVTPTTPTTPPDDNELVSKAALETALTEAKTLFEHTVISTDGKDYSSVFFWVEAEQKNIFNEAIETAEEVYLSEEATQALVDAAATVLNEAIDVFKSQRALGTKTSGFTQDDLELLIEFADDLLTFVHASIDGTDVPQKQYWVSFELIDNLNSALTAAKEAFSEANYTALNSAYSAVDNAKKPGTKADSGNEDEIDSDGNKVLGSYDADEPNQYTLLTSVKEYTIVNVDDRENVLKVSNLSDNDWAIARYDLSEYKNKIITLKFSVYVKRVGAEGSLYWFVNDGIYADIGEAVNDAETDVWYIMEGEWTGAPSAKAPSLYLSNYRNNSDITTYYVADFSIQISEIHIEDNGIKYDLGEFTWTNSNNGTPDSSVRGWDLFENNLSVIRENIANGNIKAFVIGLNAASVQASDGLNGIGIIFNTDNFWNNHQAAFPWYYDSDGKEMNGWITYDELLEYADVKDGVIYLKYFLPMHPRYNDFKAALGSVSTTYAQFGLYVNYAWDDSWHPIEEAFFLE